MQSLVVMVSDFPTKLQTGSLPDSKLQARPNQAQTTVLLANYREPLPLMNLLIRLTHLSLSATD